MRLIAIFAAVSQFLTVESVSLTPWAQMPVAHQSTFAAAQKDPVRVLASDPRTAYQPLYSGSTAESRTAHAPSLIATLQAQRRGIPSLDAELSEIIMIHEHEHYPKINVLGFSENESLVVAKTTKRAIKLARETLKILEQEGYNPPEFKKYFNADDLSTVKNIFSQIAHRTVPITVGKMLGGIHNNMKSTSRLHTYSNPTDMIEWNPESDLYELMMKTHAEKQYRRDHLTKKKLFGFATAMLHELTHQYGTTDYAYDDHECQKLKWNGMSAKNAENYRLFVKTLMNNPSHRRQHPNPYAGEWKSRMSTSISERSAIQRAPRLSRAMSIRNELIDAAKSGNINVLDAITQEIAQPMHGQNYANDPIVKSAIKDAFHSAVSLRRDGVVRVFLRKPALQPDFATLTDAFRTCLEHGESNLAAIIFEDLLSTFKDTRMVSQWIDILEEKSHHGKIRIPNVLGGVLIEAVSRRNNQPIQFLLGAPEIKPDAAAIRSAMQLAHQRWPSIIPALQRLAHSPSHSNYAPNNRY